MDRSWPSYIATRCCERSATVPIASSFSSMMSSVLSIPTDESKRRCAKDLFRKPSFACRRPTDAATCAGRDVIVHGDDDDVCSSKNKFSSKLLAAVAG